MRKFAPMAVVAALIACAGCLTVSPRAGDCANLSDTPVKKRVEEVLTKAADKAVTSDAGQPSVQGLSRGGRMSGSPGSWHSEQNFRYNFRLVKGPPDWHQDRDKSWALPAAEYPRAIRSVYTDVCAAVAEAGVKPTESRCDGSTFLVRYRVTAPGGQVVNGTLRGWIGPEDTHSHLPPLEEPYYTQIAVDVREEAARAD